MQIHVTSPPVVSMLNVSVETLLMVPLTVFATLGLPEIPPPDPSALVWISDVHMHEWGIFVLGGGGGGGGGGGHVSPQL